MTEPDTKAAAPRDLLRLESRKSRGTYFFLSFVTVLALRMLENTVHEYAHAVVVLMAGGELVGLPFVTPFGGFTSLRYVTSEWLPLLNVAGTSAAAAVMLGVFLPLFLKAKRKWLRWIAYWGCVVIPVNTVFYWFMAPLLATAENYDPVAFAENVGISPPWILGLIMALPFVLACWWMVHGTRKLRAGIIVDPSQFHTKCLVLYYIISIGFPVVSYLNLLDIFKWW